MKEKFKSIIYVICNFVLLLNFMTNIRVIGFTYLHNNTVKFLLLLIKTYAMSSREYECLFFISQLLTISLLHYTLISTIY